MRFAAAAICVFAITTAARAQDVHLTLEGMTDFPLDAGAKAIVELPYRIRLSGSVGILPGAYVNTLNDAMVGLHVYKQPVADLIGEALHTSLIARFGLGWRPFERHGFYFEAGYGLVSLGGGATSAELTQAATGKIPPNDPNAAAGYSVNSTLHMIDAEVGWQYLIADRVEIRWAFGFAGTFASHTAVSPNFTPQNPEQQAVYSAFAAQYLDNIYTSYVFTPVATLALGVKLF